jgi:hypothetical protein
MIGATRAVIGVMATLAVVTSGAAVLSRGPESDLRLVAGRLVGEATGYVAGVAVVDQTFEIAAMMIALRSVTVHVDANTKIFVGDREGVLEDLTTGSPVRVHYQMDGDRRVASVVQLGGAGTGRQPEASAAVSDPGPPRDAALTPGAEVQPSDPIGRVPSQQDEPLEPPPAAVAPRREAVEVKTPEPTPARPVPARPRRKRVESPPPRAPRVLPARESVLDLTAAVHQWIEAARRRNVSGQLRLYSQTLRDFYGRREVSREDVRAAKLRAFGSGEVITDVGSPEIQLEPSGRVAVVTFKKWFIVDGDGRARYGHGVQELRWEQTGTGWRIVAEADASSRAARAPDPETVR